MAVVVHAVERSIVGNRGPAKNAEIPITVSGDTADALADPTVKDKLLAAGFTPRSASVVEFDALTRREYERLGKVAHSAQMSAD